jgi:hypothetical protein
LIWRLFDLRSTMKTRVLCSSIFFIADSVFSGLQANRLAPKGKGKQPKVKKERSCLSQFHLQLWPRNGCPKHHIHPPVLRQRSSYSIPLHHNLPRYKITDKRTIKLTIRSSWTDPSSGHEGSTCEGI